jgi:protein TonB
MPPAVPVSPPTDSIVAAESTPPLQSVASSVDGYKREVARAIYRNNPESLFDGAPPPLLRAVVVLSLSIDPNGHLSRVNVIRSNGYRDLEEIAVRSVRRTATLPMPSRVVAPKGTAEFVETWLFRDDGRFQIRSLAEVQARAD